MPVEIILPFATERVKVRDIPALFATAIHPEVPRNAVRQIIEVKKIPKSEANRKLWCGLSAPAFAVSLTKEDHAALWASLPPLCLPIDEEAWKPYAASFDTANISDWQLLATEHDPLLTRGMLWHITVDEYEEEVRNAARKGELIPRSNLTLLPLPQADGEQLLNAFVTVENLKAYAARHEFVVSVEDGTAPAAKVKADTSPSGDHWLDKARAIADKIALKKYTTGQHEITARNICEAVATELAQDSTTHGTRGERSSGSIRSVALKGWKFIPPTGTNGTSGTNK